jgi:hypothetical protein
LDKLELNNFIRGWFIGNFEPTLFKNDALEVGVKFFHSGDKEDSHKQVISTEITVICGGSVRIGKYFMEAGEVLIIYPGEFADFEAFSSGSLVCVKFPSLPNDKVLE